MTNKLKDHTYSFGPLLLICVDHKGRANMVEVLNEEKCSYHLSQIMGMFKECSFPTQPGVYVSRFDINARRHNTWRMCEANASKLELMVTDEERSGVNNSLDFIFGTGSKVGEPTTAYVNQ